METKKQQNTAELQHLLERYDYLNKLKQETLTAIRETLTKEAYGELIEDAKRALHAQDLHDPELPFEIVHTILNDQLERLLDHYKLNKGLLSYLKGCTRRDFKSGILHHKRKLKQQAKHQNLETTSVNEMLNGFTLAPQDQAEQSPERKPLNTESLDEELNKAAAKWAKQDSQKSTTRKTLEFSYKAILFKLKGNLLNNVSPFTPSGRLRLGKAFFRQLQVDTNKSEKTIRTYLRQLEPRLKTLIH